MKIGYTWRGILAGGMYSWSATLLRPKATEVVEAERGAGEDTQVRLQHEARVRSYAYSSWGLADPHDLLR